jgi:hypothetical protein
VPTPASTRATSTASPSYSNDRTDPSRLAAALGCRELRSTTMQWGGGGGGCAAAVGNAAAAIAAGLADCVVVFRALAQGQHGRFGQARPGATAGAEMAYMAPYGVMSPAQKYAMKVRASCTTMACGRRRCAHGAGQLPPRAGQPARGDARQAAGRSALRRVALDRRALPPVRLLHGERRRGGDRAGQRRAREGPEAAAGLPAGAWRAATTARASAHNAPDYASASFDGVAQDLYAHGRMGPADVGSVQAYENFTGGVVMALAEHGFFAPAEANDFMTRQPQFAPGGRLPLNTSGGNLAECYMHGFELVIEAVRQVRGQSTAQAARSDVSLVIGGPLVTPVSSLLLGSEATR